MRILLAGRNGQVGWELERALVRLGEVVATDRDSLDLADFDAIRRVVREAKPGLIVNAAAYTAVDKAESEPELAMRVNGEAPGVLAEEAKRLGALLVHYSTDYVFDGAKCASYTEDDVPNPLSAYGKSKLRGEESVRAAGGRHLILRSGWVYARRGRNFLLTILRKAKEGAPLRVVADQFGAPTAARDVAALTADVLGSDPPRAGIFHAAASGETSWHGFATAILELAGLPATVEAIPTSAYPTPAARPKYSVLDSSLLPRTTGVRPIGPWREGLAALLSEIRQDWA